MIADLEKIEAATATDLLGQKEPLLCISLWQPWAQWIILGWKTIETRLHPRFEKLAGKRIGIHAAHCWDRQGITAAREYLTPEQISQTYEMLAARKRDGGHRLTEPEDAPRALIECETHRYGLFLRDHLKFSTPIPAIGRQGIFRVLIS